MKLRDLFTINAVILFVFGVGFLLLTEPWFSFYGLIITPATLLLSRFLGGVLLGGALLSWFIRTAEETTAQQIIVMVFAAEWAIAFIIGLADLLNKEPTLTGWFTLAVFLLFTLGFSYFGLLPFISRRAGRVKPG